MSTIRHVPLIFVVLALMLSRQLHAAEPAMRIVHVTGSGTVRVAPDVAVVSLTMTAVDDDLLRVRENSDKTAHVAFDLAKKYGAADDAVAVSRLALSLEFNKQLNRQIYNVRRDATIELTDLSKLDGLLSDLLRQPNLTVVSISFDTSKQEQHEAAALKQAVGDARQKAENLATLHEMKLGKPTDIKIDDQSDRPFVTSVVPVVGENEKANDSPLAGSRRTPAAKSTEKPLAATTTPFHFIALNAAQPAGNDVKPVAGKPFALGQITISAGVSVDYELIK